MNRPERRGTFPSLAGQVAKEKKHRAYGECKVRHLKHADKLILLLNVILSPIENKK